MSCVDDDISLHNWTITRKTAMHWLTAAPTD